jgi:hypothetical protein
MLKDLVKVANKLDQIGLTKEADYLDEVITKIAQKVANDEYYRELLRAVAKNINDAHGPNIRARSGRQDGFLSLIIGAIYNSNIQVVKEPGAEYSIYDSASDLYNSLSEILKNEKDRYYALTGVDVSKLAFQNPQEIRYSDVDKDDAGVSLHPEHQAGMYYTVWVIKTNIENTLGERIEGFFGEGDTATGMYEPWKDQVGGKQ